MNDLYRQARAYFLAVETNRIPVWWRWLLRLVTTLCVVGFGCKAYQFFGGLFHPWPGARPRWSDFCLVIGFELSAGTSLWLSVWWNQRVFVRHYQARWPEHNLQDAREVKTWLLARLLKCSPDQFFGWYKELVARRQVVQASTHTPGLNSRSLLALIYDPEGKARIWTLSSILVSVFVALAAAKLAEPEDFVNLMTAQGLEYLGLSLLVVFVMVVSTLFAIYSLLDLVRMVLAWAFSRSARSNIGREDVLDYLLQDLLRFERTKLPGLTPDEPAPPSTAAPGSVSEMTDAPADPPGSKEDSPSGQKEGEEKTPGQ